MFRVTGVYSVNGDHEFNEITPNLFQVCEQSNEIIEEQEPAGIIETQIGFHQVYL